MLDSVNPEVSKYVDINLRLTLTAPSRFDGIPRSFSIDLREIPDDLVGLSKTICDLCVRFGRQRLGCVQRTIFAQFGVDVGHSAGGRIIGLARLVVPSEASHVEDSSTLITGSRSRRRALPHPEVGMHGGTDEAGQMDVLDSRYEYLVIFATW